MSAETVSPEVAALLGRSPAGPEDVEKKETPVAEEPTPKAAEEIAKITKARMTQILSRGQNTARLESIVALVPADRWPVFVRNREEDIERYRELNFRVETDLKGIEGKTTSADNRVIVGDLILMTTSMDNIEVIREVEREMVRDKLDLERNNYRNVESSGGVPTFDETITQRG